MKLLPGLLRERKLSVLSAAFAGLVAAIVVLIWNKQLAVIIDGVGAGVSPPAGLVLRALATMLAMAAMNFIKEYAAGYACELMAHDLRTGYARYFSSLRAADAENVNAGEAVSKLQNEVAGVSEYLNAGFYQLFDDCIKFLSTFIWLLFINVALTAYVTLPALVIAAYAFKSSKIIGRETEKSLQAKEKLNRYADTLLTLFPVVRLYGAARLVTSGYMGALNDWECRTVRMEHAKAWLMSLSGVMSGAPLLCLFFFGGRMAINGSITLGTLYIFLNLSGNITGVMMNVPGQIARFNKFAAEAGRLAPQIILTKGK